VLGGYIAKRVARLKIAGRQMRSKKSSKKSFVSELLVENSEIYNQLVIKPQRLKKHKRNGVFNAFDGKSAPAVLIFAPADICIHDLF